MQTCSLFLVLKNILYKGPDLEIKPADLCCLHVTKAGQSAVVSSPPAAAKLDLKNRFPASKSKHQVFIKSAPGDGGTDPLTINQPVRVHNLLLEELPGQ